MWIEFLISSSLMRSVGSMLRPTWSCWLQNSKKTKNETKHLSFTFYHIMRFFIASFPRSISKGWSVLLDQNLSRRMGCTWNPRIVSRRYVNAWRWMKIDLNVASMMIMVSHDRWPRSVARPNCSHNWRVLGRCDVHAKRQALRSDDFRARTDSLTNLKVKWRQNLSEIKLTIYI